MFVIALGAAAASPTQATPAAYEDVLELYRSGQDRAAIAQLAALTAKDIERGENAILKAFDSTRPDEAARATAMMCVAALLHTERALGARAAGDSAEWRYHIAAAHRYVDRLARRDRNTAFSPAWWLLVIASLQGQFALLEAKEFGARAHVAIGDSAELSLAIGATEEMAWKANQEDESDYSLRGNLGAAESAYRSALARQPDLVEARLHLGRVLTLRGEIDDALRTLEPVGNAADAGFRYLGHLFEGDALERVGRAAEAEQRYLAAFAQLPEAQSARLALAHLRHANGARTEAAAEVRVTTAARVVNETSDPWFWYTRGLAWRSDGYLRALREMVH